jgi:hypothetical protein
MSHQLFILICSFLNKIPAAYPSIIYFNEAYDESNAPRIDSIFVGFYQQEGYI